MAGNFGVGASLANYSGPKLAGYGQGQEQEAMQELGAAAKAESDRNAQNKLMDAQAEQSKKQLGATLGGAAGAYAGATWGSALGPWGTLVGGVVGALAGSLF